MLQAGDQDLGQDDHAGAAHSSAAVDQHGQVGVLWVTDAVCVSPHRLDLLQIGWKETVKSVNAAAGAPADPIADAICSLRKPLRSSGQP